MSNENTAVVSRVPAAWSGRVLTRANELTALGLFLLQIVLSFGGALLPTIVGFLLSDKLFPYNKDLSFLPVGVGMACTGGLIWYLVGQVMRHPWSSRFMFYKTQSEFQKRGDPLVDPNNPDAILVEITPRRNWGQSGLGTMEDMGFMLVDAERRQLLFEGDNKRFQIPFEALISSDVEMMNPNWQKNDRSTPMAVVVCNFRERDGLGEREVPFRPMRTVAGDPLGLNYVERANNLHQRIKSLSPATPSI